MRSHFTNSHVFNRPFIQLCVYYESKTQRTSREKSRDAAADREEGFRSGAKWNLSPVLAMQQEDAGSWGPEIRAETWAIRTQTPVREAPARCLRPTLTGGSKTYAEKTKTTLKYTDRPKPPEIEKKIEKCHCTFDFRKKQRGQGVGTRSGWNNKAMEVPPVLHHT